MKNDPLCIKEDVCDMAVCDGVSSCSHAVLKTAVLAQQANNNARDEICPKCGGTGHFHFYDTMTFKDCALCKGTGKLSSVA